MLSKVLIEKEYCLYKAKAFDAFKKKEYTAAILYAQYAARIAWMFPILYTYVDDDLEKLLTDISNIIIKEKKVDIQNCKRVVFYNSQIANSGALTEQYLNFFINKGYEVLLIVLNKESIRTGSNIISNVNNSKNASLFIPDSSNVIDTINEITNKIATFNPSHAFLHFTPNDVIGYCSFAGNKAFKRYYVVHNDHTFWLGKGCSDYFLEFRKFGYLISNKRRGIEKNKILLLPFYPILQDVPFQGFPFNREGKVVGLSGASLYKYYCDPELKLFKYIKRLLDENENFVFCLCGFGDDRIVKKFITKNKLENRFFYLGKRNDFYNLIKNIDILIESYPLKGGLTLLYASNLKIPIAGIANSSRSLEDFFDLNIPYKQPTDFESFYNELTILIKNANARKNHGELFQNTPNNIISFENNLESIINNEITLHQREYNDELIIDDSDYLKQYLQLPHVKFTLNFYKFSDFEEILNFPQKVLILLKVIFLGKIYFKRRVYCIYSILRSLKKIAK